jgi:hypothetical protein
MSLDDLDAPLSQVEARIVQWVSEALELRHGSAGDPEGSLDGVLEVQHVDTAIHQLRRVRQRTDRVDELLANVTRARGRARRAEENAAWQAERAFDEATLAGQARRVEFQAAFEKRSNANLDSFEQRRVKHEAARLVSVAAEAYEVVNQIHWQLDAVRKDLRSVLNALQFEASLER